MIVNTKFAISLEEARYLRNNNITKEIVCLQGFSNANEYLYCSENNIRPVIHDLSQINIIEETLLENNIKEQPELWLWSHKRWKLKKED